jgi:hypothetical protein
MTNANQATEQQEDEEGTNAGGASEAVQDKSGGASLSASVVEDQVVVVVPPVGYFFKGFLAWCLWGHIPVVDSASTTMKSTLFSDGKAATSFGRLTGSRRALKRKAAPSDHCESFLQEGGGTTNYKTSNEGFMESNSTTATTSRHRFPLFHHTQAWFLLLEQLQRLH